MVILLKIKIIEESHEADCMQSTNNFLKDLNHNDIIDIKYSSSHFQSENDQIYSFSVCIIYNSIEDD